MFDPEKLDYSALENKGYKIAALWAFATIVIATLLSGLFAVGVGGQIATDVHVPIIIITLLTAIMSFAFYKSYIPKKLRTHKVRGFALNNGLAYHEKMEIPANSVFLGKKSVDVVQYWDTSFLTASYVLLRQTDGWESADNHYEYERNAIADYLRVDLRREVPHLILSAKKNDINLPVETYDFYKLNLEGDFGNKFDLYSPSGHHIDALKVFTPDVMMAIMDFGMGYDYELVDSFLYIYAKSGTIENADKLKKLLTAAYNIRKELSKRVKDSASANVGGFATNTVVEEAKRLQKSNRKVAKKVLTNLVIIILLYAWFPILMANARLTSDQILIAMSACILIPLVLIPVLIRINRRFK